jgi:hypothetical protein
MLLNNPVLLLATGVVFASTYTIRWSIDRMTTKDVAPLMWMGLSVAAMWAALYVANASALSEVAHIDDACSAYHQWRRFLRHQLLGIAWVVTMTGTALLATRSKWELRPWMSATGWITNLGLCAHAIYQLQYPSWAEC